MICKHYRCPYCLVISTAGEWNMQSLKCSVENKNMPNKLIAKIQYAGNSSNLKYQCPYCKEISVKKEIRPMFKQKGEPDATQK